MIDAAALARLRDVEQSLISDCMMRLGLWGWMDNVHPIQRTQRRAAKAFQRCGNQRKKFAGATTMPQT